MDDFQFHLLFGCLMAVFFMAIMKISEHQHGKNSRHVRLLTYALVPIIIIALVLDLYVVKDVPSPTDPTLFKINTAIIEKYLAGQPIDYQKFKRAIEESVYISDIAKKLKMDPTDLLRIIENESKVIRIQPKKPETPAK